MTERYTIAGDYHDWLAAHLHRSELVARDEAWALYKRVSGRRPRRLWRLLSEAGPLRRVRRLDAIAEQRAGKPWTPHWNGRVEVVARVR